LHQACFLSPFLTRTPMNSSSCYCYELALCWHRNSYVFNLPNVFGAMPFCPTATSQGFFLLRPAIYFAEFVIECNLFLVVIVEMSYSSSSLLIESSTLGYLYFEKH